MVFENVRVLGVMKGGLTGPRHVLVSGNTVEEISIEPIATSRSGNTIIVQGGERTLIPG